jgi:hypothetical protein
MNVRSSVAPIYASGVLTLLALCTPLVSSADVAVSISVAPPPLPIYEQPPLPAPGYIWTPGYWAYGPDGYFWVPGTWVEPPAVGLLWTPGYWGWNDGVFVWTPGFWAPQVGFYGGIDYGFGYPGRGYAGGYWRGNDFYYNRVVTNVTNVNVRNVYTQNVTNVTVNQVSYVGGPGGRTARPTPQEQQVTRGAHRPPTAAQTQHRDGASSQRELLASVNHGKPPIPATQRAGDFSSHPQAAAGNAHEAPARPTAHPVAPIHASELPKATRSPAAAPSASAAEQAAAREQAQLQARQEQERAALERQQSQDHASFSQQKSPNQQAYAAMERQHQQQTQQLQQRQSQQRQSAEKPPQQARSAHEPQQPDHHPGG